MCRLTAYLGPEIPLERIVVSPGHSLLQQSQHAAESKLSVNGDGFGIAWYGDGMEGNKPGLYRDVLPAWADDNLVNLCRMVKSRLFLAHVRASTTGETSRTNCHPFTHGNWSFMHNGKIADFERIRRNLESCLCDELYQARRGTTDSELLFLLLLENGLDQSPHLAVTKTIDQIVQIQDSNSSPNRITCAFSDGETIYGFRHSTDGKSPSLYLSDFLKSGGRALASEPLDQSNSNWNKILDDTFITLDQNNCSILNLSKPSLRAQDRKKLVA